MKSVLQICRQYAHVSVFCAVLVGATTWNPVWSADDLAGSGDTMAKRQETLETILRLLPPDRTQNGRVSFFDATFRDWQKRTGELPPDFDQLPSLPFLPDPLVLDEGRTNVPVSTMQQWNEKRAWMKQQLEHYITGTYPPPPDNLQAKVLEEKYDGETLVQLVELRFGPEHRAKLTLELMIPPGEGPFPVLVTQWNHREWALIAVRRGYVGCVYAGADEKDDTEAYAEIWAGKHDFTRLMRRAFGASRAIDYLYTLPCIDKDKIGFTGHSRNGDLAYIAAAFDERISAVVPSSGTAMEIPWRYSANKYDIEDIALLACAQPSWFHPRLRFFIGREHKLPIDQHHFLALIAPRPLMLSCAINERHGNPWASEQAFLSAREVYRFLGAEENLAIRLRHGLHSISARDMEDFIDFFDYAFERGGQKPAPKLFYDYSFDEWRKNGGEQIDPTNFPAQSLDEPLFDSTNASEASVAVWEERKPSVQTRIRWALGEQPSGASNPGPGRLQKNTKDEGAFGSVIARPGETSKMRVFPISPYHGFGDMLFGYFYCPSDRMDREGKLTGDELPVVIYLHEYDYAKGFSSDHNVDAVLQSIVQEGYAVFAFDMLGFGNRIEEGTRFYQRYPRWSKMGKMVLDVHAAVDALSNLDGVAEDRIYVAGYALGATVGLYSAALDERIAGVVSIAGLTPLRTVGGDRSVEGVRAYSHLHGLLPRLGYFVGREQRIPYDYHDLLACIAPRPVLVVAPQLDKDTLLPDVQHCVNQGRTVYDLYGAASKLQLFSPLDYNRLSQESLQALYSWLQARNSAENQAAPSLGDSD